MKMNQKEWDSLLIETFFTNPDAKINSIAHDVRNTHKLLRYPIYERNQFGMPVMYFVCAFLPKLAGVLFKSDLTKKEAIVNALKNSRLTVANKNYALASVVAEKNTRKKERVKLRKVSKLFSQVCEANDKLNGHEWHTIK